MTSALRKTVSPAIAALPIPLPVSMPPSTPVPAVSSAGLPAELPTKLPTALPGDGLGADSPAQVIAALTEGTLPAATLIQLLATHRLLPQLVRELVIDGAIADIAYSFEELAAACKAIYTQHQITTDAERDAWLERNQLSLENFNHQVLRNLRLKKFKQATWEAKLPSYFLQRKRSLDQVVYSLLRLQDPHLAQELYFRIEDGEQSFGELARAYSHGPEAESDGRIGPATLNTPHPAIAHQLLHSQPGEVSPPFTIGQWTVIVRLEEQIPAQLDDAMQQRLLDELFDQWLQGESDRVLDPIQSLLAASR
jgi:parvulin-like peptidyl-prolyl isomerase